jgi:hypothetical protein
MSSTTRPPAERALADRLHLSEGHRLGLVLSLSTILDDYSRYIIAWRLCTTMRAGDVTDTLEDWPWPSPAATAPRWHNRPRLLSDNGASYISGDLAAGSNKRAWTMSAAPRTIPRPRARSSAGTRPEEPHPSGELLPARRAGTPDRRPSSSTTITSATTRASETSHRPTSTQA